MKGEINSLVISLSLSLSLSLLFVYINQAIAVSLSFFLGFKKRKNETQYTRCVTESIVDSRLRDSAASALAGKTSTVSYHGLNRRRLHSKTHAT